MMARCILSRLVFLVLYLTTLLQCTAQTLPLPYHSHKKLEVRRGAVVSAHPLASQVGLRMLRQGGNAVDAAIATQLALAVVYPGAGNIGGGGFMTACLKDGRTIVLDFRETAPAKASRDIYLDSTGHPQTSRSQNGAGASGVPGTVAGLFASLKYAKLPFRKLVQPAIDLAEQGFPITRSQAAAFNEFQKDFLALNSSPVAFVKYVPWKEGDLLVQLNLAATLKRIRDRGAREFYQGETARLMVEEMQRGNGIISLDDLKNYRVRERKAVRFRYRGYDIISTPLPSSGGLILQQLMGMISRYPVKSMGFQSAAAAQLMIEAERRAFADRAAWMGDPDFVQVPVKKLTNGDYLRKRIADYTPGKAGSSTATGSGLPAESEETTHLCVLDAEGNAVSVTTTLNGQFGSRTVVGGAGFLLNNQMDDFSIKPGVPNMYGAVGNAQNAIEPNKRMLSSMTPTIVLKNGRPFIITGTPGGTTIPTTVFQVLTSLIDFGLDAETAVQAPRFHHQWMPDQVWVENDINPELAESLEKMGYTLRKKGSIGRAELIQVRNGKITAIADKRGDDGAAGY